MAEKKKFELFGKIIGGGTKDKPSIKEQESAATTSFFGRASKKGFKKKSKRRRALEE